jgi:DNA-binding CsgD family transcriptional regulator
MFDVAAALIESTGPDEAHGLFISECLGPLFQADICYYLKFDYATSIGQVARTTPHWAARAITPGDMSNSHITSNPFHDHYARPETFAPVRLSDIARPPSRRHTGVFTLAHELGISHSIAFPLSGAPRLAGFMVLRGGTDFSERDIMIAQRLQPLVVAADRQHRQSQPWRAGVAAGRLAGATDVVANLKITPRQLAVLCTMAEGLSTAHIARRLQISQRTVAKHQAQLYRKLGAADRLGAVLRAQHLGLLPLAGVDPGPVPRAEPVRHLPTATGGDRCVVCEAAVATAASGRPRAYCSAACRQRAYRRRASGPTVTVA